MEHKLKILPQYFKAVVDGTKTFEIRKNDRGFKVGDTLALQEYILPFTQPLGVKESCYTGQEITKEITYILEGGQYGLEKGYCILALKDIRDLNKETQQFKLGDTAYMMDEDYRFFESTVNEICLYNGEYFYSTGDADFDFKDIREWVFTSELNRQIHMENIAESEEEK